ncbi:MAG: hypothetical protein JWO82_759 [Akkermansiaceae bacterium]|nr:hypothetical protein [Akkermansiaceae bacterium]
MKKLLIPVLLLASAALGQAATISIKNNTRATQSLGVFQDRKLVGYVDRLKPGKTLLVKIDDKGNRPVVSFNFWGDRQYVVLPVKTAPYTMTRLIAWIR